jgi:hypothetical protein
MFVADTLKRYAAVVFLNTTGDVLNATQEDVFKTYINQEVDLWVFMPRLIVNTAGHGMAKWWCIFQVSSQTTKRAKLNVIDKNNIATKHLRYCGNALTNGIIIKPEPRSSCAY